MTEKRIRAFVAEDDPIELAGFCTILEDLGYEVVGKAGTGKKAVDGILRTKPDIILMDINMPDLDGISVLEAVNEVQLFPCIMITGYRDITLSERASKAGVFGYLQKPVDEIDIQAAIRVALSKYAEFKELRLKLRKSEKALQDRKIIEKAKGILMDKMGMAEAHAQNYIIKRSRDTNRKMVEVANEIIRRQEELNF
ncbi:MAG: response regulator [Lachnospiraceae bacterium]|nr:response regulator [Lachnospiraceae bacterium]